MNHKIYEDWLFSYLDPQEDALTADQVSSLEDHLTVCERCRTTADSWRAVEDLFRKEKVVSPKPGFVSRWQTRQRQEQEKLHRRQSLAVLIFLSGAAVVLLGSLFILSWPWLGKPEVFLWSWIYRVVSMVTLVDPVKEVVSLILRATPESFSLVWLVLAFGLLCELAVLWLVFYRVLTNPRRVTQ